eukprot:XP_017949192.1 PREDICTED: deoxyribonuclease-1-like isoform X2 [Xenopus tropicalis]
MKIASFNARRFGVKKCSDPKVSAVITKIAARYDIIVILEVFDAKEKAAKKLVEQLNREEQVKVKDTYQYEDMQHGDEDSFAREPFIVRFEAKKSGMGNALQKTVYPFCRFHHLPVGYTLFSSMRGLTTQKADPVVAQERRGPTLKDFVLIPIHTTPKDSVQEIDELYDVYEHVKEKWGTENIILLGDFNADGAYVSNKKMKTIRLRTDPDLHWLIDDDTDTTAINTTDFSYDRIVVHSSILKHVVPNSAKPFNFQEEYKMSYEEAVAVSDHYPVEVEFNPAKGIKRKKN